MQGDVYTWLTPPDPSTNHNIACEAHHNGTAQWFIQGSTFSEWKALGSLLWIHGMPGSGKSILCSTIVQDIEAMRKAGLALSAYFYFDFRDTEKQNRHNFLASLLVQIYDRSTPSCSVLSEFYSTHRHGSQQPSDGALIQCLKLYSGFQDKKPSIL